MTLGRGFGMTALVVFKSSVHETGKKPGLYRTGPTKTGTGSSSFAELSSFPVPGFAQAEQWTKPLNTGANRFYTGFFITKCCSDSLREITWGIPGRRVVVDMRRRVLYS
jgi:hypothetical protein